MSRQKTIVGTIAFRKASDSQGRDQKEVFDSFVQALTSRFRVQIDAGSDGIVRHQSAVESGLAGSHQRSGQEGAESEFETMPFTVVLTFQEGGLEPQAKRVTRALQKTLRLTAAGVTLAAVVKPELGGLALIIAALHDLVKSTLAPNDVKELAKAAHTITQANPKWSDVQDIFYNWQAKFGKLDLSKTLEEDWGRFLDKLQELRKSETGDDSTPAVVYQVSQLMGWLTKVPDGGYGFRIDGITRFDDSAVDYGEDARFDVLGPDGSRAAFEATVKGRCERLASRRRQVGC